MSEAGFWNNQKSANKTMQELKQLKQKTEPFGHIEKDFGELEELAEVVDEHDTTSIEHLKKDLDALTQRVHTLEFARMLGGPQDLNNAILSINAGAGGTESCDWAAMLLRMYKRWAERKGFKTKSVDLLSGEEAGIKNATVIIEGDYAYGYLKAERGVHRLVRISPFDSNKRRHTSFASVDVVAEIGEDIEVEINSGDLKIDTYRSSGAGGQHVNVTDSAVRITHIPTKIVVSCQDERSQHKNKAMAMKILRARIYEKQLEERRKELEADYAAKQRIEWGSQIRSYVMHPYSMVKDHRTNIETSNVNLVMDGDIDRFIEAWLKNV